jgi:hypothetical protein
LRSECARGESRARKILAEERDRLKLPNNVGAMKVSELVMRRITLRS